MMGELLAELLSSMVLALAPVVWLLVDLALLETFGLDMLSFQFDRVLMEIYIHTLVVYEQKGCSIRMVL